MSDPVLSKLNILKPQNALSLEFRDKEPSLVPLMSLMPRLVSINDSQAIQNINEQWRRLPIAIAQFPDRLENEKQPDIFW